MDPALLVLAWLENPDFPPFAPNKSLNK